MTVERPAPCPPRLMMVKSVVSDCFCMTAQLVKSAGRGLSPAALGPSPSLQRRGRWSTSPRRFLAPCPRPERCRRRCVPASASIPGRSTTDWLALRSPSSRGPPHRADPARRPRTGQAEAVVRAGPRRASQAAARQRDPAIGPSFERSHSWPDRSGRTGSARTSPERTAQVASAVERHPGVERLPECDVASPPADQPSRTPVRLLRVAEVAATERHLVAATDRDGPLGRSTSVSSMHTTRGLSGSATRIRPTYQHEQG